MPSDEHSDLEVVERSDPVNAPEYTYPYSTDPIATYVNHTSDTHKESLQQAGCNDVRGEATICGLRRKIFWIIFAVAIVVVAGAIGGGVGGALASRSSRTSNNPSTNTERLSDSHTTSADAAKSQNIIGSSSVQPSPTLSTTSITATSVVGPTATIIRDCPSSNNSVYSVTTGKAVMQFRKTCEMSYLNVNGDDFSYARVVSTLNECIDLCAAYNINSRDQIQLGKDRICNAVCWRNTFKNNETGGQCYGYTTQNVTTDGKSTWRYGIPPETKCDGAALMNQEF